MSDKNFLNSGFSKESFSKGASSIGGQEQGTSAMSSMMSAGASSGFNPYVMAGAAIIGIAKAKKEREKTLAMGDARATAEKASGESKKADIYGQISSGIRQTLGSANRKRSVNL